LFDSTLKSAIGCGDGCDFSSSYDVKTSKLLAASSSLDLTAVAAVLNSTSGFNSSVSEAASALAAMPLNNLSKTLGVTVSSKPTVETHEEEYPVPPTPSSGGGGANVGLICGLAIGMPLGFAAVGGGAYMYKKRQGGMSGPVLTNPLMDERE